MSRNHFGARLHDYVAQGFRTLALENEIIRVEVVVDKGSDIVGFLHKPSDTDFMWRRPGGLRPAPFASIPRGVDEYVFVDGYEGGWQECFPNGGQSVVYKGAELPFHGELLTAPFDVDVVADAPDQVSVRLTAETMRTPFRVEKTLTIRSGSPMLEIDERMENLADEPIHVMWGHHPAFGPPFLDESCRIDLPPCRGTTERAEPWPGTELEFAAPFDWPLAPQRDGGHRDLSVVLPPDSKTADWVRLSEFEEGWYAVTNTDRQIGFGLRWDAALFEHLWFWHVFGGMPGYPWWGRNYVFALEPWTSHPDGGVLRAIENGSALQFGARDAIETRVLAAAYEGPAGISRISEDGEVLR